MSDTAAAVSAPPATAADTADPACDVAHGKADVPASTRTLVAVFASPVARFLLGYARDAGYRAVLRDALASPARWVGVLGNPRHPAPHIPALAALGVPDDEIARVHRPIGLNIGSRTPAEIALATMAGLIADRNGRPGGFEF